MSKEHSIATGMLIALAAWTLTRLVDGVTQGGTIEYAATYAQVATGDHRPGSKITLTLTNLSRDTTVTNLNVAIYDQQGLIKFDETEPGECAFGVPAWAEGARCKPRGDGMVFMAPMLIPGTSVQVAMRYQGPITGPDRPIFRIKADADSQIRLVSPGLETQLARHELPLLAGLLVATLALLILSVGQGVIKAAAG
jgi:hypothetical protein